ncbi:hypothetical protein VP1G_03434 [Cytospora mali]|uniref:Rhodopsin domain-containing protein n=1 Tax=Cytospora mali TaxID=578113 RepID=A0A194UWQ3_CYTMA|nr:hypothetical protein VP1G_03434 [Valsa mali var. pyri (nom. inval.)]
MAVVVVVAHIAFVLGFILSCNPVAKFWDNSITQGSCIGLPFYTAFSVLTILFDIIILLLPLPNFIKLQIPRRKKFVILGLFTLGIFITAVQVIRFHTIQTLTNLVDSAKPITWSIVEGNMGIITTCIPTLAPLVKYFSDRSRLGGTSSGRGGTRSQSYALTSFRSGLRDGGIRKTELAVRTSNRSMPNIPGMLNETVELNANVNRDRFDGVVGASHENMFPI